MEHESMRFVTMPVNVEGPSWRIAHMKVLDDRSKPGERKRYEFTGFGAMEVTKPYEFIGFGAMEVTKPYEFIGFGARDATKPYEFHRVWGQDPWNTASEDRCALCGPQNRYLHQKLVWVGLMGGF